MTKLTITIKDPKVLTTTQKLRVISRAISYLIKNLHNSTNGEELGGLVYSDYEHTGAIVRITLK
jgi:hypothetical protein